VTAQGNAATSNAGGDVVVEAAQCNVANCTTTTTSMPTTTSTSTTLATPPLVAARWRFSVRIGVEAGGETTVAVPGRSGKGPVEVMSREDHLVRFRIGDRLSGDEMAALGGDTLSRLTAAAETYLRSHPVDYPFFADLTALGWAERAP